MAQPTTGWVLTWNGTEGVYTVVASAADASTTVKGVTKLSVPPISATNPVAVGDNDPRLYAILGVAPIVFTTTGTTRYISYLPTTDVYSAFAGGGQGSATALLKQFNAVDTVATAGDSVKALAATVGVVQVIRNDSLAGNDMNLYPQSGENFRGFSANAPLPISPGQSVTITCYVAGEFRI